LVTSTFESVFRFPNAQVASLLEGRERFVDAADSEFVGASIKHANGIMDLRILLVRLLLENS
jgi:hypothetical protein